MAKKAKKKSAVSRAVQTAKKAATSAARLDPKSRENDDARKKGQEKIFPALVKPTMRSNVA